MVELDRLVKLLVEKMLRSTNKPESSGSGTDEGKAAEYKTQDRVSEGITKDETDEKMPEG